MITLLAGAADTRSPSVLFNNVFGQGVLSASSEEADGFAANALGPQTFDFWKPRPIYRITGVMAANGGTATQRFGVEKYLGHRQRGFRVVGFQVENGTGATDYQKTVNGVPVSGALRNFVTYSEPTSAAQGMVVSPEVLFSGGAIFGFGPCIQFPAIVTAARGAYAVPVGHNPAATMVFSVFVQMDDGGAPVPGGTTDSGADFTVIMRASSSGVTSDVLAPSLTVTLASPATVDALALVAHDLAARGVSASLAYSVSDVSAFVPVGTFTPPDADANLLIFPAVTGRRFRLSLSGPSMPAIGVAMLGRRLVFPADVQPPYKPLAQSGRVDVIGAQSLSGQYLRPVFRRRAASGAVNLSAMPRAWFDGADALAFADHFNTGKPFVWSADPAGLPRDCAYAWRSSGAAELVPEIQPGAIHAAIGMELDAYVG